VEVYWHTVTYKTVAMLPPGCSDYFCGALSHRPDLYTAAYDKLNKSIGNGDSDAVAISQTQSKVRQPRWKSAGKEG
jgi:hypothetical protein